MIFIVILHSILHCNFCYGNVKVLINEFIRNMIEGQEIGVRYTGYFVR